jgi:hypothetical protein
MSDLRQAAQQALEALEALQGGCTDSNDGTVEAITVWCPEVIEALRAALEQPEQEPVAWLKTMYSGTRPMLEVDHLRKDTSTPVYTHPPRREWQGLTEEDMEDLLPLYSDPSANTEMLEFAAAIEVKLKEKNA